MSLTPEQTHAVNSQAQITLVIAGAGSGKTKTLTERAKCLLDRGVKPSNILALTFTRKAAGELRSRLRTLLGEDSDAVIKMSIGTVHSICLRILEAYGSRLGYKSSQLSIIDPDDRELLIDQVCRDLGFRRGKTWKSGLSGKQVEKGLEAFSAGEFINDHSRESEAVADIIQEYHGRLFAMNMLDFGRILSETARLFKEHPDVLEIYRNRWDHILVDEVQDSAQIEFSLYEALCWPACLFMVGDFRQSIYGFRWARPDLIQGFVSRPGAVLIDLRQSFRCGDVICDAANRLISHGGDQLAKPMVGASGRAGAIECFNGRSADIAARVIKERSHVSRWSDIAVLARSNRVLDRLAKVFQELFPEVPVQRAGAKFDICDGDLFKIIHSQLRLIVNPRDHLAWLRYADRLGVGILNMADIRAAAARDGISQYEVYCRNSRHTQLPFKAGTAVKELFALGNRVHFGDDAVCEWWLENCPDMTTAQALEWYSLHHRKLDPQEDVAEAEAVQLMTCHGAKGLEFPVVILTGLNEGTMPSSQSIREDGVDEERRVAYVGMTRASHRLILHYRSQADQAEDSKIQPVSRFLEEAGVLSMEAVA